MGPLHCSSLTLELPLLQKKIFLVESKPLLYTILRLVPLLQNFAVELTLESLAELDHDAFRQELIKAGGANYGTGIRE